LDTVFQEGILIAVKTVLGNLQGHGGAIEGNSVTAGLYQMGHRIIGTHIIIYHHAAGIDSRADAVIEHQGDSSVDKSLEVVVLMGVLRLGDDNAANLVLIERPADLHFPLILLIALCHHDTITPCRCFLLNTREDRGEIVMGKLRDDDPDYLHGLNLRMA